MRRIDRARTSVRAQAQWQVLASVGYEPSVQCRDSERRYEDSMLPLVPGADACTSIYLSGRVRCPRRYQQPWNADRTCRRSMLPVPSGGTFCFQERGSGGALRQGSAWHRYAWMWENEASRPDLACLTCPCNGTYSTYRTYQ